MRAVALLFLPLLLAGCASTSHDAHGESDGPAILLGFHNERDARLDVAWEILNETNASVWMANAQVPAGETLEQIHRLASRGQYTLRVTPPDSAPFHVLFHTGECDHTMLHLVLNVDATGHSERVRECHA